MICNKIVHFLFYCARPHFQTSNQRVLVVYGHKIGSFLNHTVIVTADIAGGKKIQISIYLVVIPPLES